MLGKLLKYDLKFGCRSFLGMGAAMLLATLLARFTWGGDEISELNNVFFMIVALVASGVGVGSIVLIFMNYGRNLFGSEGYLMFTLPSKRGMLLLSKCISALIWLLFMSVVALLSVFIMSGGLIFDILFAVMGQGVFWYYILYAFIGALSFILFIYLIITLSNASFGSRRVGVVLSLVGSFVYFWLMNLLGDKVFSKLVGGAMTLNYSVDARDMVVSFVPSGILTQAELAEIPQGAITVPVDISSMLWSIVMVAATFLIVRYLIKRRVDLA